MRDRVLSSRSFSRLFQVLTISATLLIAPTLSAFGSPYDYSKPPKRVALVIGNAGYIHLSQLPGSATDATTMAQRLRQIGFEVEEHLNVPNVATLDEVILPAFLQKIEPGTFVVFYFSGHGFSYRRFNYLAPTELTLTVSSTSLTRNGVSLDALESAIADRSPGMIIFLVDACRSAGGFVVDDGPLDETPSAPLGGALSINSLITWGTNLGWVSEGSSIDQLSPFTNILEKKITTKGQSFLTMFREIAADVQLATSNRQKPVFYAFSPTDPFLSPTTLNLQQERELWLSVLDAPDPTGVRRFLMLYSVSDYADAARKWLADHQNGTFVSFAPASPVAIDRSWAAAAGTARVRSLALPLGFTRSVNESRSDTAQLSDTEVGVARAGQQPTDEEQLANSLASAKAHDKVVTANPVRICSEPKACSTTGTYVAARKPLEVNGVTRGADGNQYLAVTGAGREGFVRLSPSARSTTIELGIPIEEIVLGGRRDSASGLIDRGTLEQVVRRLRDAGWTITHVSLSTPVGRGNTPRDAAISVGVDGLRLANARLVLKSLAIDPARITSVLENDDFAASGVRVRFFGRRN